VLVLESILLILVVKIVLQHIQGRSGLGLSDGVRSTYDP